MTKKDIDNIISIICPNDEDFEKPIISPAYLKNELEALALEQEPCEMTAEEYRQRMIQAFHNAGTDELIAVCVLPTEKEFEHLEWLLKNHYKKESCDDAIRRQAVLDYIYNNLGLGDEENGKDVERQMELESSYRYVKSLPPVTPQPKMGRWIESKGYDDRDHFYICSECGRHINMICGAKLSDYPYCHCGAKMVEP